MSWSSCPAAVAKPSIYAAKRFSCGPGAERRDPTKQFYIKMVFYDPVVLVALKVPVKKREVPAAFKVPVERKTVMIAKPAVMKAAADPSMDAAMFDDIL